MGIYHDILEKKDEHSKIQMAITRPSGKCFKMADLDDGAKEVRGCAEFFVERVDRERWRRMARKCDVHHSKEYPLYTVDQVRASVPRHGAALYGEVGELLCLSEGPVTGRPVQHA